MSSRTEIEVALLERAHAEVSIRRDHHLEPAAIEQRGRDFLVHDVVLDQEGAALRLRRGRGQRRRSRLCRFGGRPARRTGRLGDVRQAHRRDGRRHDAQHGVIAALDRRIGRAPHQQDGRHREFRSFRVAQERHRRPVADARAQDGQVVRGPDRELGHQLLGRGREREHGAVTPQRGGKRLSRAGMVRAHQHSQSAEASRRRGRHSLDHTLQRDLQRESRAVSELARQPQAAVHQRHQPRRDRQAQAGAAEAARGRAVRLRERRKDRRLPRRRDADAGVFDQHHQPVVAVASRARAGRAASRRRAR